MLEDTIQTQAEVINIEQEIELRENLEESKLLSNLSPCPKLDIEFQDLSYSVPLGRKGSKLILRNINGSFKSGELTAILGPSGAGKSTLLNVLAGYKSYEATGAILLNGKPRNIKQFRKMSRYIMQQDLLQPGLTVLEAMTVAADLKLGRSVSAEQKQNIITEILGLLRLSKAMQTTTIRLSGGERKRLSIALELVNNPPVIFLDEPTTGLDDLASSQCISLLKKVAQEGRTVICSIHTPSAKLFSMFDHVFIVSTGQCVYQGSSGHVVDFLQGVGLTCPVHYNPADFVIEVSCGAYGNFTDKMVSAVENGKCRAWLPSDRSSEAILNNVTSEDPDNICSTEEFKSKQFKFHTSSWDQFRILLNRMMLQTYRNAKYLWIKVILHIFLGFVIGGLFSQMGNDASKTLFNFGFCFTCIIFFMYLPMLPVLLQFPIDVQLLKREHFNRWYSLNAYYAAMTMSRIPIQILLALVYIPMVYLITDQPLEIDRIAMFVSSCILMALVSESFACAISSVLNIVNGMFVGPALSVPFMLLAVYGFGYGTATVPFHIRIAMSVSYLRYGLEAIVIAIYGGDRPDMICPDEEVYCQYKNPAYLMEIMGMKDVVFWIDILALCIAFCVFNGFGYYVLRQKLSPGRSFAGLNYIVRIVKHRLRLGSHY